MDDKHTTPTSITSNEAKYLLAIVESDYSEGEDAWDGDIDSIVGIPVWDWDPAQQFGTSAGGIASSLNKKGLAYSGGEGKDATIEITLEGLQALRATR